VKLKEMPSLIELTRQVELINKSFDDICHSGKNLTIRLQKVLPEPGEVNNNNLNELNNQAKKDMGSKAEEQKQNTK
jgi:hypothetical protein